MKKTLTVIVFLFFASVLSYSQVGFKAGINLASLTNDDDDSDYTTMLGFHAGAFYDLHLRNNFYLQPQFLLSYDPTKGTYKIFDKEHTFKDEVVEKAGYLTAPILLLYKIPLKNKKKISLGVGPYISVGVFGNRRHKRWEDGAAEKTHKISLFTETRYLTDTGIAGGINYEINNYLESVYTVRLFRFFKIKSRAHFFLFELYQLHQPCILILACGITILFQKTTELCIPSPCFWFLYLFFVITWTLPKKS